MNKNSREKYKKAILDTYHSNDNNALGSNSEKPSPANIKRRLLNIASTEPLMEQDENAIRIYLGLSKSDSLINGIKKDTEVYKSIQNFLLEKTSSSTKPGLLEVAAILVDLKERPISVFVKNKKTKEPPNDPIEEVKIEPVILPIEKPIEEKPIEVDSVKVDSEKLTNQNTSKNNKKKIGLLLFLFVFCLGILFFLPKENKVETNNGLPIDSTKIETNNDIAMEHATIEPSINPIPTPELEEALKKLSQLKNQLKVDSLNRIIRLKEDLERKYLDSINKIKDKEPINDDEIKEKTIKPTQGVPLNFNTKPLDVATEYIITNGSLNQNTNSPNKEEENPSIKPKKILEENNVELCFNNPNFYARKIKLTHHNSDYVTILEIPGENSKKCTYNLPLGVYTCEIFTTFTKKRLYQYQLKIKDTRKEITIAKDQYN